MKFETPKIGISGYIGMRIVKEDGEERWTNIDPETGLGPKNLIVDVGLNELGYQTAAAASDYCRVGTGSTAPSSGQTDLVSRFGVVSSQGANSTASNSGAAPWWHQRQREYTFGAGDADGAALTEVGFFKDNTTGNMFSRSLIKDGTGTPTSITLTATEVLYVTYNIRVNVPNSDVTGTFQINSEDYNYTIRAANASSTTSWSPIQDITEMDEVYAKETQTLGLITSTPSGANLSGTDSADSYTDLSNERTTTVTFSDTQGNTGTGIGSFVIGHNNGICWQVSVDKVSDGSKIDKDNTKSLTMNSFFKLAWDRA